MSAAGYLSKIDYDGLGALGDYLLDCKDRALRPRTIVLKHQRLSAMQRAVGVPLEALDEAGARRWWRGLTRRDVSPATRAVYLSHARSFYAWAMRDDVVTLDPTRKIIGPKRRVGVPRDVDPAVVVRIIAGADPRVGLVMCLMLWGGLRCLEVAAVRGQDVITRAEGDVVLRVFGKGGAERVVKLPAWLSARVQAVGPGWAFPSPRGAGVAPVEPATVGRWVADTLRAGGLDATAHQLRHTNATAIWREQRDVLALQAHLGHATLATVQTYARAVGLDEQLVEGLFGGPGAPGAATAGAAAASE